MGRIFLEHMGGSRLFSCAKCDTNLTNRSELISTRFTGATGRAFLFNRVVNLTYSEVQDRVMLTGRHMVSISCVEWFVWVVSDSSVVKNLILHKER